MLQLLSLKVTFKNVILRLELELKKVHVMELTEEIEMGKGR